jgi:hypothetical protein
MANAVPRAIERQRMNERIEPDVIAALLDGTLEPSERERVLGRIMASPDEYEELVEIARTLRALEARPPGVTQEAAAREDARAGARARTQRPGRGAARRIRPAWIALPAAAAAVLAAILIVGPGRDRAATELFDPRGAGSIERTFGAAWSQPGWSTPRGEEAIVAPAAAYRAGVLATRFDMAALAVDSAASREVGSALRALLGTNPEVRPLVRAYEDAMASVTEAAPGVPAPPTPDPLSRTGSGASAWYELGRAVERARLLAAAGRLDLLESDGRALDAASQGIDNAHPNAAAVRARVDDAVRVIRESGNARRRAELQDLLAEVTRIASG